MFARIPLKEAIEKSPQKERPTGHGRLRRPNLHTLSSVNASLEKMLNASVAAEVQLKSDDADPYRLGMPDQRAIEIKSGVARHQSPAAERHVLPAVNLKRLRDAARLKPGRLSVAVAQI